MFPLLDLDDDVIAATLGFADPRSLCSAIMTCRRLRRLADAAWVELDRELDPNQREGGNTPRERVLSSFMVHSDIDRIRRVAHHCVLHDHIGPDPRQITLAELASRDHLLYLRIINTSNDSVYYDSFIGASGALRISQDEVHLPMQRIHVKGDFDDALSVVSYFMANRSPYAFSAVSNKIRSTLRNVKILIFAFDRRNLSQRTLINEVSRPINRVPSMNGLQSLDGTQRLEVRNNWARVLVNRNEFYQNELYTRAAAPFARTEVRFYFQDESFGLMIQTYSSNIY